MNTAIIVAAGNGKRVGGSIPKQYLRIHGKTLINYTIQCFESCDLIDKIVLVVSESEEKNVSKYLDRGEFEKLQDIVIGGETRAESVLRGLESIDEETAEIVAVHDGARPLVSVEEITMTIKAAQENGAACLSLAVTDTIKQVRNDKIVNTIDRSTLRKALTPQCFSYRILKRAFEENEIDESVTDECFLVEKLGYEITFVEGSAKNIKITTKDDFLIAEAFLG